MEFNRIYNRQEFVNFLQNSFLPEDFMPSTTPVEFRTKMKYTTQAIKLGSSDTLDLVVYEVKHNSKNDARISLSKEAFRMLADEMEDRALVIFVPEDNNDNYRFSLIEITLEVKDDSARITRNYSNPRRYSYFLGKGIAYYTPNKYLNEKGRVVSPEDLRSRFSVEVLTKEFYQELSDWYAWAIKIIRFPNDLNDKTDDDKFNNESAIRLITRLIFVWFLKQRHLVPDEFFDEKYIADNLIASFNPHAKVDLFYKSDESKYYKAILQNLFFAMLNSPITPEGSKELSERHFRKGRGDYDNNKLMRYEVGQAEENKDESYQVPVTIEPVNIYQTLEQHSSDVTQEMLSQGEDPSTAEGFTRVLTESMRRAIDGVSYAEEETVEITVAQDASGAYGISDADMQKIADTMMPQ